MELYHHTSVRLHAVLLVKLRDKFTVAVPVAAGGVSARRAAVVCEMVRFPPASARLLLHVLSKLWCSTRLHGVMYWNRAAHRMRRNDCMILPVLLYV
jgi:hypothetical protein